MNTNLVKIVFAVFVIIASGCEDSGHKNKSANKKADIQPVKNQSAEIIKIEPGKVYKSIRCLNRPEYSYSIYLPQSYNDSVKFPVLYLFDPHAKGSEPVEKYREIADEFKMIIACSNNSKNGLSSGEINMISYSFISDVRSRFGIDPAKVYAGGFSGGARIAVEVADMDKNIKGVIGCGAGVPNESFINKIDFNYFLTAGNKDFNYKELVKLSESLKQANVNYCFMEFDGKHEWPEPDVIKTAIYFFILNADNEKEIDPRIIKEYKKFENKNLKDAKGRNDMIEQIAIYERMIIILNKVDNTIGYNKNLKTLYTTKQWSEHKKNLAKALETETRMQSFFRNNFASQSTGWWNDQINILIENSKNAPTVEERLMNKRLLNYLSLVAYMYSDNALKNGKLAEAQNYLFIYEKVDPENTEVYYLKAVYYAMQNRKDLALDELKKAVKLGFDDFERIYKDSHFTFGDAEIQSIINEGGKS
jgi:hypothetical protein